MYDFISDGAATWYWTSTTATTNVLFRRVSSTRIARSGMNEAYSVRCVED